MSDKWISYLLGLDLGQAQDSTALSVIERAITEQGMNPQTLEKTYAVTYDLLYLERFPLMTDYTVIADRVKEVCLSKPMKDNLKLVVDATGVGRGVMDMLRERLRDTEVFLVPITITGGDKAVYVDGGYRVPKRDLVAVVRVILEADHLKFAEDLPLLDILKGELRGFRVMITKSANDIYEAREGQHDDIVLSAALPLWYGNVYGLKAPPMPPRPRNPDPWERRFKSKSGMW